MIKAIIFDLDGVYFPTGAKNFVRNVARIYKVPEEKVKETYDSEEMQEYKRGKLSKEEYWGYVAKMLGINASADELLKILIGGYSVDEEIALLVEKTKSQGIKTVIFTNNFPERISMLDEKFNFLKDFDIVILSYEIGETKPDKKMFEVLLEKTGCKPEEIFVIDDNKNIIKSLEERGFVCVHYQNIGQLKKDLKDKKILEEAKKCSKQ